MPHGAESKYTSLNEDNFLLMEGKVHIWNQTWKMSLQMLPKSFKQFSKSLMFKTHTCFTVLKWAIDLSSVETLQYKRFCKCSPTQADKPRFHDKVTFTARLSPFFETEICHLEKQELLVLLEVFHEHK